MVRAVFPSRHRTLAPDVCPPDLYSQVFGVWLGLVDLATPLAHPVLYPLR